MCILHFCTKRWTVYMWMYCSLCTLNALNWTDTSGSVHWWCDVLFFTASGNHTFAIFHQAFFSPVTQFNRKFVILKHDLKNWTTYKKTSWQGNDDYKSVLFMSLSDSIAWTMCFCMYGLYIHIQHLSCLFPLLSTAHHYQIKVQQHIEVKPSHTVWYFRNFLPQHYYIK